VQTPPRYQQRPNRSQAANIGFSELTIAALLGHAARGVTQDYVRIAKAVTRRRA